METSKYDLFVKWCDDKGIELLDWQRRFAELFLNDDIEGLVASREAATGKTFLANAIRDFLADEEPTFSAEIYFVAKEDEGDG